MMDKLNLEFPSGSPVFMYELNEVPWRVVDWYVQHKPGSNLAKLLGNAISLTSVTFDEGELHPWTTWPSFHRGTWNRQHQIRFLNQDRSCADAFPPIWEVLAKAGKRVGVFGSLQSYPKPPDLDFCFYIPDTFAPGPETYPSRYEAFQRLNLRQTKRDGAMAAEISIDGNVLKDLLLLKLNGMRFSTCTDFARHLLHEPLNGLYKTRRPVLQALLSFDVYCHALRKYQPEFSTFFTNHVAGIMHRYWKYAFPEDFNYQMKNQEDYFHRESLLWAMDIVDQQIGFLSRVADEKKGSLIIASSMGQQAIERDYCGEMRIEDKHKFCEAIGFRPAFKDHLAMQPDFNFEFSTAEDCDDFIKRIENLCDFSGKPVFYRIQRANLTVDLSLGCPPDIIEKEVVVYTSPSGAVSEIPFEKLGLKSLWRDVGTGYHQPYGIFIWYRAGLDASGGRAEIESAQIAPRILKSMGIDRPESVQNETAFLAG